ncbi:MAG: hypothetical protein U0324_33890 [Polyangiales bacterium]
MRFRYAALLAVLAGCSFNTNNVIIVADAPSPDVDAAPPPPDATPDAAPDAAPPPPDAAPDAPDDIPTPPDAAPDAAPDAPAEAAVDAPADAPAEAGDVPLLLDGDECPTGQTRCNDQCVDTNTAADNCGRCNNRCAAANAASTCAAGACAFTCNAGFADCDMNPANGCEADLSAPATCGSCSNRCAGMNGTPTCAAGVCGLTCNPGFGNCDGNAANGCETATTTSASHCGMCGRACSNSNGTPSCVAGACQITCDTGYLDCDGNNANGCETLGLNDTANCGRCGTRCPTSQSCVRGSCTTVCADTMCGAACVDLMTSATNCGTCGRVCSTTNGTPRCVGGTCGIATCNTGFANCDSNAANGCEAAIQTDVNNCGACANRCNFPNAASTCVGGACALGACNPGFGNCDGNAANGCETNLSGDIANCGACSNRCTAPNGTPSCSAGACGVAACNTGFANCNAMAADGCEVNTLTDQFNCGACGLRCNYNTGTASNTCGGGACMPTCNAGYLNCDGDPRNGCESSINANNACGGCGRLCALSCAAGGACSGVSPGSYTRVVSPRTFIDACAQPGHLNLVAGADDSSAAFALPFATRFWSGTVAAGFQIGIGTNGWINMTTSTANDLRTMIPDPLAPNGIIAAYMLDLFTGPMGVCVATVGVAPSRAVVVEWRDVLFYNPRGTPQDFEVVLNEGSTAIDLLYRVVAPTPPGYQATVGLESPNGVAAAIVCNGANTSCGVSNGTAIRFQ